MHLEDSKHKQWTYTQAETLLRGICSCFFFELFHSEGSLQGPVSVHTLFWTWSWFAPIFFRAEVWQKLSWGAAWRLCWPLPLFASAQPQEDVHVLRGLGHAAGLVCLPPGRGYGQVALGRVSSSCTKRCGMQRDRLCDPEEKGNASRHLVPARCSEMWENGSYGKTQLFCMCMHISMHYVRWEQECRAVQSSFVPAYFSSPISASGLPQDWAPAECEQLCGRSQAPEALHSWDCS